jgi:error-prone DNA polymerase
MALDLSAKALKAPTLPEVIRMTYAMIDTYCRSYARAPAAITLDIDDTCDVVHGNQQLALFHTHYDERCFLPIHVYDAANARPVVVLLRPGKTPSGVEIRAHVRRMVRRIRTHWPDTRITLRGDRWGGRPQASECQNPGRAKTNRQGPSAMAITMIGLDTAKSVFQVHGVDSAGKVQLKRKLRREELLSFFEKQEKCTVVIEACGAGHHWARVLTALGHDVKLVAPEAARPFVKKGKKNDPADAAALCEAARRPDIKFVPIKTTEQQAALALHSARSLLVKQETMLANAMRGLATEFGVTVPKGMDKLEELIAQVGTDETIPECARQAIGELHSHCGVVATRIATLEAKIVNHARHDETARRLATVPGIGPITASMISASVGDNIGAFKSARHFAAWLGLVPSQHSTGGKIRLGRITKTGNKEIRRLLVLGATSMVRRAAQWNSAAGIWVRGVLERRPVRLATVALANKMARIAWALMTRKEVYRAKGGASVAVEAVA